MHTMDAHPCASIGIHAHWGFVQYRLSYRSVRSTPDPTLLWEKADVIHPMLLREVANVAGTPSPTLLREKADMGERAIIQLCCNEYKNGSHSLTFGHWDRIKGVGWGHFIGLVVPPQHETTLVQQPCYGLYLSCGGA
jgi:hypothetical protein